MVLKESILIKYAICILLGAFFVPMHAQEDFNAYSLHEVYTFGNYIDLKEPTSFLTSLRTELDKNTSTFTILITGDIVNKKYNSSFADVQLNQFTALIDLIAKYSNGKLVFVPGDRDWANGKKQGLKSIKEIEVSLKKYCALKGISNFHWIVKNGCPGPFSLSLDEHVELIGVNSQWWNHTKDKPIPQDAACRFITDKDIREELFDIIDENINKNILIAGHHPIQSLGNYGGRFSVGQHLLPLPIVGSIRNYYKANVGGDKDISNPRLQEYGEIMENVILSNNNIIYATSHEANQQIYKVEDNIYINSGALSNPRYAGFSRDALLSEKANGIIKITYYKDGKVTSSLLRFNATTKRLSEDAALDLFYSACNIEAHSKDASENLNYLPCSFENAYRSTEETTDKEIKNVLRLSASTRYKKGKWNAFWFGKHYRDDWAAEIETNYLNIDTATDGLIVKERGGGSETKSLKFKTQDGTVYTFRSVDKDPNRKLNYSLRATIISKIFRDQTSSQQPYGALIIPSLLSEIDVLHVEPKLYVLPNIPALGPFQKQYGDLLGMLEELPGKRNMEGKLFAEADDIVKTNKLIRRLYEDKSNAVRQTDYLRARLFDILVGDWSRQEDNWKWAAFERDGRTEYLPIPRDRDAAFSKWDGILPTIADMSFGFPVVEGFDYKVKGFRSLVFYARHLDRFLLTSLSKEDYTKEAQFIIDNISDQDIIEAVNKLPQPIHNLSGIEISEKLIQRKKDLLTYASSYYKWLNKEIELLGSKGRDKFLIESLENGKVRIQIFDNGKNIASREKYFDRIFNPDETELIKIYGLAKDDIYEFVNPYKSTIELVLLGGNGEDEYYYEKPNKHWKIYDLGNLKDESIDKKSFIDNWNHTIYQYDRNATKFNTYFPVLSIAFNRFQGGILSVGNTWTTQKWNKTDFAAKYRAVGSVSTATNWGLDLTAQWHQVIRDMDVIANVSLSNPEYYNAFYGIGNNTVIDEKLDRQDFYVANFSAYTASIGLQKSFWQRSSISVEIGLGQFDSNPVKNSILDLNENDILGADGLFTSIPSKLQLEVNLLDHERFPYKGIRSNIFYKYYKVIEGLEQNYGSVGGTFEYYISNNTKKRITLGFKLGADLGFGEIPFFHTPTMGGNNGLRGYTGFRFTDQNMLYFNTDLRLELLNKKAVSIPVKFGLIAFYDAGKVFDHGEIKQTRFNTSLGGGFYLIPFTRSFSMSFILGWSKENSFYPGFRFGTFLN